MQKVKQHPMIQESQHKEKYDHIYSEMMEQYPENMIKDKVEIIEDSPREK